MTAERTLWAGLDPGRTGGIALIDSSGAAMVCALEKCSETEVANFLRQYAPHIIFATIEKVWMRPGDPPTVGVLVTSYGFLRGLLAAFDIPRSEVTPQKWQGKLGVPGDDKPALRQFMSQRYPGTRWTDAVGAAGCLAHYTYITGTRIAINGERDGLGDSREPETGIAPEREDGNAPLTQAGKALREWSEGN